MSDYSSHIATIVLIATLSVCCGLSVLVVLALLCYRHYAQAQGQSSRWQHCQFPKQYRRPRYSQLASVAMEEEAEEQLSLAGNRRSSSRKGTDSTETPAATVGKYGSSTTASPYDTATACTSLDGSDTSARTSTSTAGAEAVRPETTASTGSRATTAGDCQPADLTGPVSTSAKPAAMPGHYVDAPDPVVQYEYEQPQESAASASEARPMGSAQPRSQITAAAEVLPNKTAHGSVQFEVEYNYSERTVSVTLISAFGLGSPMLSVCVTVHLLPFSKQVEYRQKHSGQVVEPVQKHCGRSVPEIVVTSAEANSTVVHYTEGDLAYVNGPGEVHPWKSKIFIHDPNPNYNQIFKFPNMEPDDVARAELVFVLKSILVREVNLPPCHQQIIVPGKYSAGPRKLLGCVRCPLDEVIFQRAGWGHVLPGKQEFDEYPPGTAQYGEVTMAMQVRRSYVAVNVLKFANLPLDFSHGPVDVVVKVHFLLEVGNDLFSIGGRNSHTITVGSAHAYAVRIECMLMRKNIPPGREVVVRVSVKRKDRGFLHGPIGLVDITRSARCQEARRLWGDAITDIRPRDSDVPIIIYSRPHSLPMRRYDGR